MGLHWALLLLLPTLRSVHARSTARHCRRFDEIYVSGKDLCEELWGTSFKYEVDEAAAYTMWFFDSANPNDAISQALGKLKETGRHRCNLGSHQEDVPGPQPDDFSECHPWKSNACCSRPTVSSYGSLKEKFGTDYQWDRCGPLSPECERFFVQEACFYECDPNAGLFRELDTTGDPRCDWHDAEYNRSRECMHSKWELQRMPIKASYCNAWFTACRKDHFCAASKGDFFSCPGMYIPADRSVELVNRTWEKISEGLGDAVVIAEEGLATAVTTVLMFLVIVLLAVCACSCYLIRRERMGKPVFQKVDTPGPSLMGASQEYLEMQTL